MDHQNPNLLLRRKRSSPSVKKEKPKETVLNDKGSSDVDKLNAKSKLGLPMTNHCETGICYMYIQ